MRIFRSMLERVIYVLDHKLCFFANINHYFASHVRAWYSVSVSRSLSSFSMSDPEFGMTILDRLMSASRLFLRASEYFYSSSEVLHMSCGICRDMRYRYELEYLHCEPWYKYRLLHRLPYSRVMYMMYRDLSIALLPRAVFSSTMARSSLVVHRSRGCVP